MTRQSAILLTALLALAGCGYIGGDQRQVSRAEAALASGDYNEAVVILRNVTGGSGDNARAQLLLARAQMMRGEMQGAEAALAAATGPGVDAAALAELRADMALRQGRAAELLQDIQGGRLALPRPRLDYYRARSLQAQGQPVQALNLFESLQQSDPASVEIAIHVAECHATLGRRDIALSGLEKILASHPDSAEAWSLRARLLQVAGDATAARESLGKAIGLAAGQLSAPEQVALLTLEAGTALDRGEVDAASAVREKLLRLLPQAPLVELLGAQISLLKGDAPEAVNALQRLIQHSPDSTAMARPALLGALLAAGNVEQAAFESGKLAGTGADAARNRAAQAAIRQAASSPAGSEARALQGATAALLLQQPVAARRLLDSGARSHPESLPLQIAGVELALQAGQASEAVRRARELQQKAPDDPRVINALASALSASKDLPGAIALYEQLWKRAPSGQVAAVLSQLRVRAGSADALQPLAGWVASHPQDMAARMLLASAYQESAQFDNARSEYEKVVAAQPQQVVALNNLAWLYSRAGDNRAMALARRAYELAPRIASVADTYGWLLAESGDAAKAIPMLQEAVRAAPDNPDFRYHLAAALLRAGGDAQAQTGRELLRDVLRDQKPSETRAQAERLLAALKPQAP